MYKTKGLKIFCSVTLTLILLLNAASSYAAFADEPSDTASFLEKTVTSANIWELTPYKEWILQNNDVTKASNTIRIEANDYIPSNEDGAAQTQNGEVILTEGSHAQFSVTAPSKGLYTLKIGYEAIMGESLFSSPIEISLETNGKIPYKEASKLFFSRTYESMEKTFEKDEFGNDMQPTQKEVSAERAYILNDNTGYNPTGLYILLEDGVNTVTLKALRSGIKIKWLELSPIDDVITYSRYKENHAKTSQDNSKEPAWLIEAEDIYQKSDCTISPVTDRSSGSVTPNSPDVMLLNTVGGGNFSTVGQWAAWTVDIKKSGFYKIALRCRQNTNAGAVSSRKITIDGKLPFREASELLFPYSQNYSALTLKSGQTELEFYFDEGKHEICLEVVLGPMAEYLEQISNTLSSLNNDYLRILFYTGSKPDIYREYGFEKLIPDVIEDFKKQSEILKNVSQGLKNLSFSNGGSTATLDRLSILLAKMSKDTDKIAPNFEPLNESLAALGTWLNTYTSQPLQIDSITVFPSAQQTKNKKDSFFSNLWFKAKIFIASFTNNYSSKAGDTKEVNVWIATGRDQSKVISRLSNNDAKKTGINARVRLVTADSLLPNVLAGTAVDVYINAEAASPIDYAIRGAVLDLKQFSDFDELSKRFHPAALEPFSYKNAVYALPESLDFPLMFYRKDIFDRLEINVPKTWDEFYETVALLQKNNLTVGVAWTDMFNILLCQSGGSYYNKEKTESALSQYSSLDAFAKTTRLYTDYGLPVEFSFANRFRNGNMPLGIVPYTMYNQLYLFAPEIDGLWEFSVVPGIKGEDGSINNSVVSGGSGAIILRTTKDKNASWKFLKWWTQPQTQTDFGLEMEKVMGPAARQSSANIDVVKGFPWTSHEFSVIENQWNKITAIPQIPGSYYTQRTLDFAFSSAYSLKQDPSRTLQENVKQLNDEIERKTAEFEDK